MTDSPDKNAQHETSFWDSWWAFVFLVAAIFLGRYFILEPFKIPSGSMEPTLIGNEDYGDRIVTNKLAYVTALQAALVLAGTAAVILFGFFASKGWRRKRSIINTSLFALAVLGGMGFLWWRGDIAGPPKRFDVVVFLHESRWDGPSAEENKQTNYIKRLIGLPGDKIMTSGGNLFLFNPKTGNYEIIRVWETRPELQAALWYPVAKAWAPCPYTGLSKEEAQQRGLAEEDVRQAQASLDNLRFPWSGAETEKAGVKLDSHGLELDGAAPVELTYKYEVKNIHLRQGRWPFRHLNCPGAHLEGSGEARVSNPLQKPENITAYVSDTWAGIECPNCKQVMFPVSKDLNQKPYFEPQLYQNPSTGKQLTFFDYSDDVVGDLKLDLSIALSAPGGRVEIEVGSNLHRAKWVIPSNLSAADTAASSDSVHAVTKPTPALSPGKHMLSLAYVDGTVVAALDGNELECQPIAVEPLKAAAKQMQSVARLKFDGVKGRITRLDLYRDLIHITKEPNLVRQPRRRSVSAADATQIFEIPEGEYLMLGDNGPSSADSRVWGFVPKDNLIGRASFIWWPPSRWRVIK